MTPKAEQQNEILDSLKKVYLFAILTAAEIRFLMPGVKRRTFKNNEVILREGDPAVSLFILETGAVCVIKANPTGGAPKILTTLSRGLFGEVPLVSGGGRSASVMAVQDSTALEIHYDFIEKLTQSNPTFGIKLFKSLGKYLAETLSKANLEMTVAKPEIRPLQKKKNDPSVVEGSVDAEDKDSGILQYGEIPSDDK